MQMSTPRPFTALLIRHAEKDVPGNIVAGRTPGVGLSAAGRAQAARLAVLLAEEPLAAVYSSPMERCLQTAAPLAEQRGIGVQVLAEETEIDFGAWTGAAVADVRGTPEWCLLGRARSGLTIPGGEWLPAVQARGVRGIEAVRRRHPGTTVAIVSHGDVIKAILAWYLGLPLDQSPRLEISPASRSRLALYPYGPHVLEINTAVC